VKQPLGIPLRVVLAAAALAPLAGAEARVFHVRDFGAVPDRATECGDARRAAIRSAMEAGPGSEVVLEARTYRVSPAGERGYCFPIQRAAGLTVRGVGVDTKVVVADPAAGAFPLGLGRAIVLRDLTIDYDPVPFCQGTVLAMDPEAGSFDLEIEAGYPTPDATNFVDAIEPYGKWGMIIDRQTRRIRAGTPDHYMTPR